ncbi:MAG: hypothetical protein K2Q09_11835 [Phycisphaerales bacterium]|nr:hypothetical protein [Chloroflexota bacterium]MBY0309425.1 hypothetical protein [Phycisphaerales bacterium]
MRVTRRCVAIVAPLALCAQAFAQPAQIGPGIAFGSGGGTFEGPSIYTYPVPVAYFSLAGIAPDGLVPASDGFSYSFNIADYSFTLTGAYTYTTSPTVTSISGWVRLTSSISNATSIPASVSGYGSLTIPVTLLTNANVTSTFTTPGDLPLAVGTYQGYGMATAGPPGPAGAVPGFDMNGAYTPGQYVIGGYLTSLLTATNADVAAQDVRINFQVVIEAVPAPGAAALGLIALYPAARRNRRR